MHHLCPFATFDQGFLLIHPDEWTKNGLSVVPDKAPNLLFIYLSDLQIMLTFIKYVFSVLKHHKVNYIQVCAAVHIQMREVPPDSPNHSFHGTQPGP